MTMLPRNVYCNHTIPYVWVYVNQPELFEARAALQFTTVFNSLVFDFLVRQRVTAHLTFFFLYQMPVPRLTAANAAFGPIVERAARLICTTPEFDDLAQEVGLRSHKQGATDPAERARLRAELDGLVAHLYGLTYDEFAYILTTFPLVAPAVKDAALEAYRAVDNGQVR